MRTENSRAAATNIVDKKPQESLKNERKTLQVLQQAAGKDKENLVGAGRSLRSTTNAKEGLQIAKEIIDEKQIILNEHLKESSVAQPSKRQKKMPSSIVKGKSKVKAEDLMSAGEPSEKYWSVVAEKRRIALETALEENLALHEKVALLEEENATNKKLLEETNHVIELLREMVAGDDTDIDMSTTINSTVLSDVNDDVVDMTSDDIEDKPTDDVVDMTSDDDEDKPTDDVVDKPTNDTNEY